MTRGKLTCDNFYLSFFSFLVLYFPPVLQSRYNFRFNTSFILFYSSSFVCFFFCCFFCFVCLLYTFFFFRSFWSSGSAIKVCFYFLYSFNSILTNVDFIFYFMVAFLLCSSLLPPITTFLSTFHHSFHFFSFPMITPFHFLLLFITPFHLPSFFIVPFICYYLSTLFISSFFTLFYLLLLPITSFHLP
jgi:hypothetical protein